MLDLASILPARSLGICRVSATPGHLGIPLAGNTNDKATAFAGSIFSLAALSGYDTVFERQRERSVKGDLFLLSSTITYHRPGLGDLTAESSVTEDFVRTGRGNFKMGVRVEVWGEGRSELIATFEGAYVVRAVRP